MRNIYNYKLDLKKKSTNQVLKVKNNNNLQLYCQHNLKKKEKLHKIGNYKIII